MMKSRAILGALMLCALVSLPAQAADRIVIDLRNGIDKIRPAYIYGPEVKAVAKSDANGLRFTIPATHPHSWEIGIGLSQWLRGDFTIDLGYELLALSEPSEPGLGIQLRVEFESPSFPLTAALTRMCRAAAPSKAKLFEKVPPIGDTFGTVRIDRNKDGKESYNSNHYRAENPAGRLRFIRDGIMAQFWVAEGQSGYQKLRELEIDSDDVKEIRLYCSRGDKPAAMDILFTDLTIEGTKITAEEAKFSTQGEAAKIETPPLPPPPGPGALVIVLRVMIGGLILVAVGAIGFYLAQRERKPR